MPAKKEIPNIDNLISRYEAGESTNELIGEFGIGKTTLYRILGKHGIERQSRLYRSIPDSEVVRGYLMGESELSLSKRYGIDRNGIRRRLLRAGITPRTGSQAAFIMMSKLSPIERQARSAAAHVAAKGRIQPYSEREQRAKTREAKQLGISKAELILADMLRERGFSNITPQKAVGKYNIDIVIEEPRIAVEIYGGNFHTTHRHARRENERFPYILNSGWHVIVIWVNARHHPLTIDAANYIVAFIQSIGSNKTIRCQYRMVYGDGEPVTAPSMNLNGLT